MSRGKDIRSTMEIALENATAEYLNMKTAQGPTADETRVARGTVRGLAIANAILRDPDDQDNSGMHKIIEKEFLGRVT